MRTLATLMMSLAMAGAVAQEAPLKVEEFNNRFETIDVREVGRFRYQILFEAIGPEGQSMDEFALQIATLLRQWSDSSQFEACGVIATDGKRYGILVGSAHSHVACTNFPGLVPEGMKDIGLTIHSHGTDQGFIINAMDIKLLGETMGGGSFGKNTRRLIQKLSGQSLDEFSENDFTSGPGYLAGTDGKVFFQSGKSAQRVIKARLIL